MKKRFLNNDAFKKITAPNIFILFFLISLVTIGGGYAMVPVIARALAKKEWMSEHDFYDHFALAQSFPGPLALNAAMVSGFSLLNLKGLIAAFFGIILPPFISVVIVSALFFSFGTLPIVNAFLVGAAWTIPGLVAAMAYKMLVSTKWSIPAIVFVLLGITSMILFPVFTVPLFFTIVLLSFLWGKKWSI